MTERGVPRGTAMPRHASRATSKPCSRAVGTSGNAGSRAGMSVASSRTWPCLTGAASAAGKLHHRVDVPAEQARHHLRRAERHLVDLDARRC